LQHPLFADYDNDGFMDVFFSGDGATDAFYRNQGDGTFVDVTAAAGLKPLRNGHGIAWGDHNNDGLLDLCSLAQSCARRAASEFGLFRRAG